MPETPHSSSHVLQTRKGVRRTTLHYDPNVFTEDMTLSVSLLVGEDVPGETHFNTLQTEGEYKDGILLHAVPMETSVLGMKNVVAPLTTSYFINSEYDPTNAYTYAWSVSEGTARLTEQATGKEVRVAFSEDGVSRLECTITNEFGGNRTVAMSIFAGLTPKTMLIVRNGENIS